MAITWRSVKKLNAPDPVGVFEKKYGFVIPDDLESCIINNNGGRPTPKVFTTDAGAEYEVKSLLSYNEEDSENIYKVIDFFVKNYGTTVLPFARDSGGNYYCVKNGKIVFWTQEMEFYSVCDSFSDFIKLLEDGQ